MLTTDFHKIYLQPNARACQDPLLGSLPMVSDILCIKPERLKFSTAVEERLNVLTSRGT